nr:MAG TPA: hypothetical protein [Caudoviricetes sp.]
MNIEWGRLLARSLTSNRHNTQWPPRQSLWFPVLYWYSR